MKARKRVLLEMGSEVMEGCEVQLKQWTAKHTWGRALSSNSVMQALSDSTMMRGVSERATGKGENKRRELYEILKRLLLNEKILLGISI